MIPIGASIIVIIHGLLELFLSSSIPYLHFDFIILIICILDSEIDSNGAMISVNEFPITVSGDERGFANSRGSYQDYFENEVVGFAQMTGLIQHIFI